MVRLLSNRRSLVARLIASLDDVTKTVTTLILADNEGEDEGEATETGDVAWRQAERDPERRGRR